MRRAQLEHAIRAACSIAEIDSVVIVGSQSILGSFSDAELPDIATRSAEVDILPDLPEVLRIRELADRIEVIAGEMSLFEVQHGFALDGVDDTTCALASGWRERLVAVRTEGTRDVQTGQQYTGWCLSPEDLCVAKLCAGREKDRRFVAALIAEGLVDSARIRHLLRDVEDRHRAASERAVAEFFPETR